MHILLSGKQGSPVAAIGEELKKKWGALGTAVYVHDAKAPIHLMRSALHSVARQFGYTDEPDGEDFFMDHALLDWARERDVQFWGKSARRSVDEVTGRWEAMGLFHVAVVTNLCYREDYELFPRAYRVYVMPPLEHKPHMIHGHHSSETSLDPWVKESGAARFPVFDHVLMAKEDGEAELAREIFEGFNERFKSGFRTLMN